MNNNIWSFFIIGSQIVFISNLGLLKRSAWPNICAVYFGMSSFRLIGSSFVWIEHLTTMLCLKNKTDDKQQETY